MTLYFQMTRKLKILKWFPVKCDPLKQFAGLARLPRHVLHDCGVVLKSSFNLRLQTCSRNDKTKTAAGKVCKSRTALFSVRRVLSIHALQLSLPCSCKLQNLNSPETVKNDLLDISGDDKYGHLLRSLFGRDFALSETAFSQLSNPDIVEVWTPYSSWSSASESFTFD